MGDPEFAFWIADASSELELVEFGVLGLSTGGVEPLGCKMEVRNFDHDAIAGS
jgi:hypothetical protein